MFGIINGVRGVGYDGAVFPNAEELKWAISSLCYTVMTVLCGQCKSRTLIWEGFSEQQGFVVEELSANTARCSDWLRRRLSGR